jgi:hypothetical protein
VDAAVLRQVRAREAFPAVVSAEKIGLGGFCPLMFIQILRLENQFPGVRTFACCVSNSCGCAVISVSAGARPRGAEACCGQGNRQFFTVCYT